jgi:hypothetical protein
MHAPENNMNDCELILEETRYYMGLMSQQCTVEFRHFNNFKMIVRAIFTQWNVELVILCVQRLPEEGTLKPNHVRVGT